MIKYRIPERESNFSSGSLSSMIDIIFLLIIFFVVTASFDDAQIDSTVVLPTVSEGSAVKSLPPHRLIINVAADGSVGTGFDQIPAAEIEVRLPEILARQNTASPEPLTVVINGDGNTPHHFIATVLQAVARSGVPQVRIHAQIEDGSSL